MTKTEILLRDYLKKINTGFQDFYCVHIHASFLVSENKREYKAKVIEESLQILAQQGKCRFFHMYNEDFFLFYQEKNKDDINTMLMKIRFYFADNEQLKSHNSSLFTFYDVSNDFDSLEEVIKGLFETPYEDDYLYKEKKSIDPNRALNDINFIQTKEHKPKIIKKKLSPTMLGRIEKSLVQVDFSSIIRRQSVCAIFGKSFPQPLFDEVFVAISDLQETLMPDIDFAASPWLFNHLTEVLDKGVLLSISKHDYGSLNMEFSVNLNTRTIISSDFSKFDTKISSALRSTIVLELHPSDVFSDLHTFILARDYAKTKGYRICLDGMSIDLMRYIDKKMLGVDLIKLFWTPKLMDAITNNREEIKQLVRKFGDDKVILSRVDDAMAVEMGQSVGLSLFQGRYINSILASDPRKRRVGSVLMKR